MLNHGLSQNEIQIIFQTICIYHSKIVQVKIFGSRANGQYKPYSDIDLVLYGEKLEQQDIDRLNTFFDESSLGLSVDIKGYHQIKYPPLKRHIDTTAKTLFTNKQNRTANN